MFQLDEHWNGKGNPRRLNGDAIAPLARIVALAQSVDVFSAVRGREAAREMVRERSGRWFEPEVATAFLRIADDDPLWDDLPPRRPRRSWCATSTRPSSTPWPTRRRSTASARRSPT